MRIFALLRRKAGTTLLALAIIFAGFRAAAEAWQISTLHSFGIPDASASGATFGVILAKDGKLYGTASAGGPGGGGAIFRIDKDGRNFELVHAFTNSHDFSSVASPFPGVLAASDGRLYGTTVAGGTNSGGTVFSLNLDGSDFQVVYDFELSPDDSLIEPRGELIEGTDGMLYGSTRRGGAVFLNGTIFRVGKNGSNYQVLHEFDSTSDQGMFLEAPLFQASDGALYGITLFSSTVFKLNTDGSGYEVIHDFGDEFSSFSGLIEGRDGALYGNTQLGGVGQGGVIFKLRKNGTGYAVLHSFYTKKLNEPAVPFGPLLEGPTGLLYGVSRYGIPGQRGTIFCLTESGLNFRVVQSFGNSSTDVNGPVGPLAQDVNGDVYATSLAGGIGGGGTIFKSDLAGHRQILHSFNSTGGDAGNPNSRLSQGTDGSLYGTSQIGGSFGKGTVFQVNPNGSNYNVLLNLNDRPVAVAADPTNSDLYLVTAMSGSGGEGALYRMTGQGKLKMLHHFRGYPKDGSQPGAPLVGSDGLLYGITASGGTNGGGVIYRINKSGKGYQILHQFAGFSSDPPPLMEGSDGMLYGVQRGPAGFTLGTAFKIGKDGTGFAVLHTFRTTDVGGAYPAGPLLEGSDDLIYGTTENASTSVAYVMDKSGDNFQILHTFDTYNGPLTGLVEGNGGALYGVFYTGNNSVFRLQRDGLGFSVIGSIGDTSLNISLVKLLDGSLCGTTERDGDMNLGKIFKLTPP